MCFVVFLGEYRQLFDLSTWPWYAIHYKGCQQSVKLLRVLCFTGVNV